MERLQELGDGDAADRWPARQALCRGRRRRKVFPTSDGTAEDDVLLLGQPVQAEELADAGAIRARSKLTGCPPRSARRWGLLEARLLQPQGEAMLVRGGSISVLEQSSRNSTWLSFPWRAW